MRNIDNFFVLEDTVLWPEDLKQWKNPPCIIMSGKDTIIPSNRVKELLMQQQPMLTTTRDMGGGEHEVVEEAKLVVVWLSDTDHGGFLFDSKILREVEHCILNPPRPLVGESTRYQLVTSARHVNPLLKKKRIRKAMGLLE